VAAAIAKPITTSFKRKRELLFSYAPGHCVDTLVDPALVLEHFTTPPQDVRGIAISGVNREVIRDQWAECIVLTTNSFDRAGKGFMAHPMWTLPEEGQDGTFPRLASIREKSFNFGWPEYPGSRGADW
jgi:hypothetical protein